MNGSTMKNIGMCALLSVGLAMAVGVGCGGKPPARTTEVVPMMSTGDLKALYSTIGIKNSAAIKSVSVLGVFDSANFRIYVKLVAHADASGSLQGAPWQQVRKPTTHPVIRKQYQLECYYKMPWWKPLPVAATDRVYAWIGGQQDIVVAIEKQLDQEVVLHVLLWRGRTKTPLETQLIAALRRGRDARLDTSFPSREEPYELVWTQVAEPEKASGDKPSPNPGG